MSPLLIAFLGVTLLPLFIATWRASLVGLTAQGLLLILIWYRIEGAPKSAADWITLVDLVGVRSIGAPLVLYRVLQSQRAPARADVLAPNLLSWTLAMGLVLACFNLSERLVSEQGDARTLVAVALAGALLAFLVLAGQSGVFGQMIGALRFENAILLLELGGARGHDPAWMKLGLLIVAATTVGFFRYYLTHLARPSAEASRESAPEGPSL